jgi:hypothetical protein
MADDGVRATPYQPAVGSSEAEGAAEGKERHDADGEAEKLDAKPYHNTPMRMRANWPEQHTAKRAAESKKPVAEPSGHRAGRASDEVGNHNPHLLDQERRADEAVCVQVILDARLRKECRAGGSDEFPRDPDETLGSGGQEIWL